MNTPVIATIHSGLGNQLFQLAAAEELARLRSSNLTVVGGQHVIAALERLLGHNVPRTTRRFDLRIPAYVQPSRLGTYLTTAGLKVARSRANVILQSPAQHYEAPHPMYLRLAKSRRPVLMAGYFQHPSYSPAAAPDLARRLSISITADKLRAETVGLHLRRGDYLRLGWQLSARFYEQAMKAIDPSRALVVRIASDDILAAEAMAQRLSTLGWPASLEPPRSYPHEDMLALAACQHMIMSNSTYSWWAALIGDECWREGSRVVVAPDPWLPAAALPAAPPGRLALAAVLESRLPDMSK